MGRLTPNSGELPLDLRYFRNKLYDALGLAVGELLPGLPYFRNRAFMSICSVRMNCCLIYGTSETLERALMPSQMVNYYLNYGTSETDDQSSPLASPVNYYLNYGTSETEQ